jgi:hypothetical protein
MISDATPSKTDDVEEALSDTLKHVDCGAVVRSRGFEPQSVEDILPVTAGQLYMLARWPDSDGEPRPSSRWGQSGQSMEGTMQATLCYEQRFVQNGESQLHILQVALKVVRDDVGLLESTQGDSYSFTSQLSRHRRRGCWQNPVSQNSPRAV